MSDEVSMLLRPGLLEGVGVVLASAPASSAGSPAAVLSASARRLGAEVSELALGGLAEVEEDAAEAAIAAALERAGSMQALVIDGTSLFEARGGREGLISSLALAWNAARAATKLAFLPGSAGGRIFLLSPGAGAPYAAPAAAGFENLARTLSIEWARYSITTVAIAPAATTSPDQLATLACYLLSPAGAYFSGCLMDLRGPRGAPG